MSGARLRRFYGEVALTRNAAPMDGEGGRADAGADFGIVLDGKPCLSPARAPLIVPSKRMAEALADEWRAQGAYIVPETMPLSRLAFTAIDRVGAYRDAVIEDVVAYGRSDLLCYRADSPPDLVARQQQCWDPLLAWVKDNLDVALSVGTGLEFIVQDECAMTALAQIASEEPAFRLAALHLLATNTGSSVLAFALVRGRLEPEAAFAAANLDELYQIERWGDDEAAQQSRSARMAELEAAVKFLHLLSSCAHTQGVDVQEQSRNLAGGRAK